jgi:hypothetical protein
MRKFFLFFFVLSCGNSKASAEKAHKFSFPPEANYPLDSLAEGIGIFVNRLDGYMVRAFKEFSASSRLGMFVFYDKDRDYAFVSGFVRGKGEEAIRNALRVISHHITSDPVFKKTEGGTLIYFNTKYPYEILGKIKGGNYRGIMMVIDGDKLSRVSILIFPQNPDEGMLGKLRELAESFKVIPAKERVAYTYGAIYDPAGIPAIYLPVPDGWKLEGQAIKTGVQAWGAYYRLYSGEAFLALDNLSAEANSVMGNSQTMLKINGNASMIGGFVVVGTREGCINSVFSYFWPGYKLEYVKDLPPPNYVPQGVSATSLFIKGTKGDTTRYGFAVCFGVGFGDYMSSYASGNLNLITMSMPSQKSNYYGPLMLSILNGMQTNPEWLALIDKRFVNEARRINEITKAIIEEKRREAEMFRAYLKENREISEGWRQTLSEGNEWVSDLNTAWANLLGEKTYVKDPGTGEIFRLDDRGGDFYKEPTFGTIWENVPKDYELQRFLQEMGFEKLPSTIWKMR